VKADMMIDAGRPAVRTVLGDIAPECLGVCDYHDHLFQVSPLLTGDELDLEKPSQEEAATMVAAGIQAMVEATPTGLGRRPEAVARISLATGLNVVHATGFHREEHYEPGSWVLKATESQLAARVKRDVTAGLGIDDCVEDSPTARTPDGQLIRAGLVKVGAGYWRISSFERRALAAAAQAGADTGAPVMVHLEHGSAAWEVLAVLNGCGLSCDRIALAHVDRNLDPYLHTELTQAGAYIGYDGMARHRLAPDSALIDCLRRALELGADPSRLLIGADVARASRFRAYGGLPGMEYLPKRFLPRLERCLGQSVVEGFMRANPARWLTLEASACGSEACS
jgi:phosphotriesterase-related protein